MFENDTSDIELLVWNTENCPLFATPYTVAPRFVQKSGFPFILHPHALVLLPNNIRFEYELGFVDGGDDEVCQGSDALFPLRDIRASVPLTTVAMEPLTTDTYEGDAPNPGLSHANVPFVA